MRDTPIAPRARWPEPQPVPRGRPPVPALPGALLPGALAPWVADVAERVQCPPDFVAMGVLVAAAAVIGRKVAIRPKRQDDWAVVPNLWGLAVGPPGMMKSPALAEVRISVEMITQIGSVITRIGSRDHCGSGLETRCGPWALSLCSRAVAARPAVFTEPIQLITRLRSR